MSAFSSPSLTADLLEVKRLYANFFAARSPADWERHTEPNQRGWTLRETVAHLDAAGKVYLDTLDATLNQGPGYFFGELTRADLPAWNRREIDARAPRPITEICESFLNTLQKTADDFAHLSPAALHQSAIVPFYQRPITVGELLGSQATHPGLVHGAQVANGAGVAPLWRQFPSEMLHRQITRFLHLMALSYWPERGGELRATLEFSAAGPGGGQWHMTLTPAGCEVAEGALRGATLQLKFRSADALCRTFTQQLSPTRALLTAQCWAWGDVRLGFRMGRLFNPA